LFAGTAACHVTETTVMRPSSAVQYSHHPAHYRYSDRLPRFVVSTRQQNKEQD
jgi:hypothetical protein